MDDFLYRGLLALLLIGFVIHRGYYTRKSQRLETSVRAQPSLGWLSRLANLLALPALLAAAVYIIYPRWMAWSALPFPYGVRWLGVGIALAGFALLQGSQAALGKNWSDAPRMLEDQQMVASGPYRWVRHPIYAAFLLIFASVLLISANWFVGGLLLLMTGLDVAARIRVEEGLLVGQFGDGYRAYMRSTGRLLPMLGRSIRR